VPVIKAGAAEGAIVNAKAELADEVELGAGGGTEAGDGAGVGRGLGLSEGGVEHGELGRLAPGEASGGDAPRDGGPAAGVQRGRASAAFSPRCIHRGLSKFGRSVFYGFAGFQAIFSEEASRLTASVSRVAGKMRGMRRCPDRRLGS